MSGGHTRDLDVRSLLPERSAVVDGLDIIWKGLLLGGIAGMATFTYVQHHYALAFVDRFVALGLLAFAGVLNYFITEELSRGLWISFIATGVGVLIYTVSWMLPLYVAGYSPIAIKLLFFNRLGTGILGVLLVMPMTYYGGYFASLLGFGAFRP